MSCSSDDGLTLHPAQLQGTMQQLCALGTLQPLPPLLTPYSTPPAAVAETQPAAGEEAPAEPGAAADEASGVLAAARWLAYRVTLEEQLSAATVRVGGVCLSVGWHCAQSSQWQITNASFLACH
jgi:hypothetical protein